MRRKQAAQANPRPDENDVLLGRLHPRLATWFRQTYPGLTHAQTLSVPSILDRQSILLTSPTGSGKTLAAFLGIFDAILRTLDAGMLGPQVRCIYVSPLRALAYDIGKNISAPIRGMGLEKELPARRDLEMFSIRVVLSNEVLALPSEILALAREIDAFPSELVALPSKIAALSCCFVQLPTQLLMVFA